MNEDTESNEFKLLTFNILAPCYYKIAPNKVFESQFQDSYLKRNEDICNQLLKSDADVICLQEFWIQSKEITSLYYSKLSEKYDIKLLQRTSHWRSREDGLAMLINRKRVVIQDSKDILFHDCGDRVAQLLLLAIQPSTNLSLSSESPTITKPYQQFICVNTHLLFPHNSYSTTIRKREISKILDFIESYRQRELCETICGRSDVSCFCV
jgi:hypothetical protein